MSRIRRIHLVLTVFGLSALLLPLFTTLALPQVKKPSSYTGVVEGNFDEVMARMSAEQPAIQKKHADLLEARYDLANRAAQGVTMSRGKAVQDGPRAKLAAGVTWDDLGKM